MELKGPVTEAAQPKATLQTGVNNLSDNRPQLQFSVESQPVSEPEKLLRRHRLRSGEGGAHNETMWAGLWRTYTIDRDVGETR